MKFKAYRTSHRPECLELRKKGFKYPVASYYFGPRQLMLVHHPSKLSLEGEAFFLEVIFNKGFNVSEVYFHQVILPSSSRKIK